MIKATVENGCMHIIPKSHQDGHIIHFKRRDWQICDDQIEGTGCLAAPLNSGGMLIFDGLLHHGTPENHSPENRYALQFHYTGKSIKQITDEQRLEIYGPEGKNVTC